MPLERDDWNDHWAKYADSANENPAQAYRRRLIALALSSHGRPARILDIGSGQGDMAAYLRDVFPEAKIRGIELSQTGVDIARKKVPTATFTQRDLLEPAVLSPAEREWATHAVCTEVLEHVEAPEVLLAAAQAYLAPGGWLFVTVPGGPMSAFDRHIGHRRHYRPADLRAVLESGGLETVAVSGAGFPFFNLYRLLVILRGKRLVQDAKSEAGQLPWSARAVMRLFSVLFRLNLDNFPWGWQIVALARKR
jgi:SAM-dependent methyltransferase